MRWHSASGARHEFRVMKFLCVEGDRQMAFEEQPVETVRSMVTTGKDDAFADGGEKGEGRGPMWSRDAQERLARVPGFVRGMVKKIYADYARERGIAEITPTVMDTARAELGLEGM